MKVLFDESQVGFGGGDGREFVLHRAVLGRDVGMLVTVLEAMHQIIAMSGPGTREQTVTLRLQPIDIGIVLFGFSLFVFGGLSQPSTFLAARIVRPQAVVPLIQCREMVREPMVATMNAVGELIDSRFEIVQLT